MVMQSPLSVIIGIFLALFGFNSNTPSFQNNNNIIKSSKIVVLEFEPIVKDLKKITDEEMETAVDILMLRMHIKSQSGSKIEVHESKRIIIEIQKEKYKDKDILDIMKNGNIKFVDDYGKTVIYGKDIIETYAVPNSQNPKSWIIQLKISPKAAKIFGNETERISKQQSTGKNHISIMIDNKVLSRPSVNSRIDSDSPIIEGNFTEEEATYQASFINSGALPFSLKLISKTEKN